MKNIIDNLNPSDIEKIDKNDIIYSLSKLELNLNEIKQLPIKIRKLIIWILKLTKEYNLDKNNKDFKSDILDILFMENISIWYSFSKIMWENEETLKNRIIKSQKKLKQKTKEAEKIINNLQKKLEYINYYERKTGLANEYKLQNDILEIEEHKIIILIKIIWFEEINNTYHYNWWDDILLSITNKLKKDFEEYGFKLYRVWWVTFWLLKECAEEWNQKKEEMLLFLKNYASKGIQIKTKDWFEIHIDIKSWVACHKKAKIENAVLAISEAKSPGDVIKYDDKLEEQINSKSKSKIEWRNNFKKHINQWNLVPFFQWMRNNITWKIEKYETLARIKENWEIFSPWIFIPSIQNTSLMQELTKKMLIESIKKMQWNNLLFSVNLSENDINNPEIVELIEKNLKLYNIEAERLTIEILEESIWENKIFYKNIKKIKKIWVKIAIDDFWTWYSNFMRVYRIKPDYLKIDWSLIQKINNDTKVWEIVNSITQFSHNMWIKVIAEYVDKEDIQKELEKIKVDYSQWYLFSKPEENIVNN